MQLPWEGFGGMTKVRESSQALERSELFGFRGVSITGCVKEETVTMAGLPWGGLPPVSGSHRCSGWLQSTPFTRSLGHPHSAIEGVRAPAYSLGRAAITGGMATQGRVRPTPTIVNPAAAIPARTPTACGTIWAS